MNGKWKKGLFILEIVLVVLVLLVFSACSSPEESLLEDESVIKATDFTLSASSTKVEVGQSISITLTLNPSNAEAFFHSDRKGASLLRESELHFSFSEASTDATVSAEDGSLISMDSDTLYRFDTNTRTFNVTASMVGTANVSVVFSCSTSSKTYQSLSSNILTLDFVGKFVSTKEQLVAIANNPTSSYILANDIDLSGEEWTPIPKFSGALDGNGHKITNISIQSSNETSLGFVSENDGVIQNVEFENLSIFASGDADTIGGVAGKNKGIIDSCKVSGSINAIYYDTIGGIVGFNNNGFVYSNVNYTVIQGQALIGGIVGKAYTDGDNHIYNNVNHASVSGVNDVGGIAGYVYGDGKIARNTNNGAISGENYVGGVFGRSSSRTLSSLTNTGTVTGTKDYVGGLVGYISSTSASTITSSINTANVTGANYVGGYLGWDDSTTIQVAVNDNTITGKGYIGGIAGWAKYVENCTNNGSIVSTGAIIQDGVSIAGVGGVAGYTGGLSRCANNATISIPYAGRYVGGLAGRISGSGDNTINDNRLKQCGRYCGLY